MYEIILNNTSIVSTNNVQIEHIISCKPNSDNKLNVIFPDSIVKPCILMKCTDKYYLSPITKGMMEKILN